MISRVQNHFFIWVQAVCERHWAGKQLLGTSEIWIGLERMHPGVVAIAAASAVHGLIVSKSSVAAWSEATSDLRKDRLLGRRFAFRGSSVALRPTADEGFLGSVFRDLLHCRIDLRASAQSELSELEPPVVIRSFAVIPQANGPGCLRISGVESRLQFGKACIFSILERIFLASFRAKCIRDSS
jgi:hypothetical protein